MASVERWNIEITEEYMKWFQTLDEGQQDAIRVDMAPLAPDPARLQPVTLTIPIRLTRLPLENYQEQLLIGK